MKTLSILLLIGALGFTLALPALETEQEFEEEFGITYQNKHMEADGAKNLAMEEEEIEKQNKLYEEGKATYKEKVVEQDDEDPEEFFSSHTGLNPGAARDEVFPYARGFIYDPTLKNTPEEQARLDEIYTSFDRQSIPNSWDSRAKGWVTSVKHQGSCGSCAAFATGAVIESCLLKAGAPMSGLDVSEQKLLDCAYGQNGNNGCNGASLHGYSYYQAGKQITHENTYSYQAATTGNCQNKAYWNPGAKVVDKHVDFNVNDQKLMQMVMNYGSVVICVIAGENGFSNYAGGVYNTCGSTGAGPDHAVALIGWGTENGVNYWLIKNSWGKSWGDSGYIKIRRGTCHITQCGGAALKCAPNGSQQTVPQGSGDGVQEACDMNHLWPNLMGTKWLETYGPTDGKFRKVQAKCFHGLCTPTESKGNSCMTICGADPCKQSGGGGGNGGGGASKPCGIPKYKGDGYCDDENNHAGCAYDGGDCCGGKTSYCKQCKCLDPNAKPKCNDNASYASTCPSWAKAGFCQGQWAAFMKSKCPKSCNSC